MPYPLGILPPGFITTQSYHFYTGAHERRFGPNNVICSRNNKYNKNEKWITDTVSPESIAYFQSVHELTANVMSKLNRLQWEQEGGSELLNDFKLILIADIFNGSLAS